MEKILVTTDMSSNSKSAVRLAIKQAVARGAELDILYVYYLIKPFNWTPLAFDVYSAEYKKKTFKELSSFFKRILHEAGDPSVSYKLVLVSDINTTEGIISYALENNCSFICIATRGAGNIKKLFGTHTSKLIGKSPVPVLAVPSNYRLRPLHKILYASDITDYERELKQVVAFARPIGAMIRLLHIRQSYEFTLDPDIVSPSLKKRLNYDIDILTTEREVSNTLLDDIGTVLKKVKPDILVLFTRQHRSLTDKLISSSNAKNSSFESKIPLLTFPKVAD
ncbi:universal stress protein [Mucilaginibacter sp. 14171R-50]|uniref:universal stress protein n=1 Tax=Mucilaginibacter sp. 14171R-50 TaxID=2703789 RepID=UPI00138B810C|nr:universal stress protein [Mucilaginibacter sp. 14171R-50]QHS56829.1 universal stress protein [Mucilaginibacter sp. 14171R-50]